MTIQLPLAAHDAGLAGIMMAMGVSARAASHEVMRLSVAFNLRCASQ